MVTKTNVVFAYLAAKEVIASYNKLSRLFAIYRWDEGFSGENPIAQEMDILARTIDLLMGKLPDYHIERVCAQLVDVVEDDTDTTEYNRILLIRNEKQ